MYYWREIICKWIYQIYLLDQESTKNSIKYTTVLVRKSSKFYQINNSKYNKLIPIRIT